MKILLRLALIFLMGAMLLALYLYSYNAGSSRFVADDYCFAYRVAESGLWGSQHFWYTNWSGRFAATFVNSVVVLGGPRIHGYLVFGFLLLWAITASTLGHQITKLVRLPDSPLNGAALALTAILFWVSTVVRFDNGQSLYWTTGAVSYALPLLLTTIYVSLGLYVWSHSVARLSPIIWFILAGMLAFVTSGFSEVYAVTQVAVHFTLLGLIAVYWKAQTRQRMLLFVGSGLIGSVAALAITALAPGNSVRMATLATLGVTTPDLLRIPVILLQSIFVFLSEMIVAAPIPVLLMVVAIPASIALLYHPPANETDDGARYRTIARALVVVPVVALMVISIGFVPAAYVLAASAPPRSLTAAVLIFGVGLMAWSYAAGLAIRPVQPRARAAARAGSLAAIVASIVVPLWLAKQTLAEGDRLMAFAEAWESRHSELVEGANAGLETVTSEVLVNGFGLSDLRDDPKYWVNSCMARYYGVGSIVTPSTVH